MHLTRLPISVAMVVVHETPKAGLYRADLRFVVSVFALRLELSPPVERTLGSSMRCATDGARASSSRTAGRPTALAREPAGRRSSTRAGTSARVAVRPPVMVRVIRSSRPLLVASVCRQRLRVSIAQRLELLHEESCIRGLRVGLLEQALDRAP